MHLSISLIYFLPILCFCSLILMKLIEVHASDDEDANVGNMGHANVDEDAYAMPPPPPPVHPMQPQWECDAPGFGRVN
jgi:hypothetical protein